MGDLGKKTTVTAEALANLLEQFKGKVSLEGFATPFLDQLQDIENAAFQLIDDRTLDASVGVQLDGLGQIIGLPRGGLDDDTYRTRLRAQILVNLSSGTVEEILEIVDLVLGAGLFTLELVQIFPAQYDLTIVEPFDGDGVPVNQSMQSAEAGGVRGVLIWAPTAPFQYDTGLGYDDGAYGMALD